jgi:beta-glucosidase-like glycosyl hydrolase
LYQRASDAIDELSHSRWCYNRVRLHVDNGIENAAKETTNKRILRGQESLQYGQNHQKGRKQPCDDQRQLRDKATAHSQQTLPNRNKPQLPLPIVTRHEGAVF